LNNERFPVPAMASDAEYVAAQGQRFSFPALPDGGRQTLPLSAIAVARSGDKGDRAHVAVIARDPRFAALIGEQITTASVSRWFAHLARGRVTRYDVPGVNAFNFVLDEALGGGGAASLRNDPLGKTFGQILLSHPVEVPAAWVPETDAGYRGAFPA
jgi:hypothetical protein